MSRSAIGAAVLLGLIAVGTVEAQDAPSSAAGALDEGDPRALVELLADVSAIAPGERFRVGVRFELDPHWHVYWHNPGDGAMATEVELSGPGVTFSELRWPAPARFEQAGFIVTYGYEGETVLLAEATAPADARGEIVIEAVADFLVCEVECIPDRLTVRRAIAVGERHPAGADTLALFERFAARVPVSPEEAGVDVDVTIEPPVIAPGSEIDAEVRVRCGGARDVCAGLGAPEGGAAHAFFPDRIEGITFRPTRFRRTADGAVITVEGRASPDPPQADRRLSGVLVLDREGGEPLRLRVDALLPPGAQPVAGPFEPEEVGATVPALPLWQAVLLALLGGLLLNLMPCVLPVLAIKAFGLVRTVGEGARPRAAHAAAYAGGILATFLALAAVVLGVRAGGTELGWGFQLQEPMFVALLAGVLVVFALRLFGVFSFSVGAGGLARRVDEASGLSRSVGEGVLAVVVATPCTAPFLGTAVGFALAGDAAVVLAVFLAVGVGLAAPFGLLVLVPGTRRLLPRPGPWMERFEVVLGFALLATVVWLAWLLGRVAGSDGVVRLLAFLLAIGLATWIAGTWALRLEVSAPKRAVAAVGAVLLAVAAGIGALRFEADAGRAGPTSDGWAEWSPDAVRAALEAGDVVFVDFTADWCITCKVNETLVLEGGAVAEALRSEGVAPFEADWTRRDEVIRAELARYGRAGVPMYLVISPEAPDRPQVLPELLTEDIVLEALRRAAPSGDGPR